MTRVLYRKLLADAKVFLAVICVLLLGFEMLWAHVSWRISQDILQKLTIAKKVTPGTKYARPFSTDRARRCRRSWGAKKSASNIPRT